MLVFLFNSFALRSWFFDVFGQLLRYLDTMNTLQWSVVSACVVAFGFLCLRGSGVNR